MENPIKVARTRANKTLVEFADEIGVHWQLVFLAERGTYPQIPTSIAKYIAPNLNKRLEVNAEYRQFQRERRTQFGQLYGVADVSLGPPEGGHPVVLLRRSIGRTAGHPHGLSRMAFAKSFCVHSAELFSLEEGRKRILSEQFKEAMREAGLRDTVLSELEFRCEEFAGGEWVNSRAD